MRCDGVVGWWIVSGVHDVSLVGPLVNQVRKVANRDILPTVLKGFASAAVNRRRELRYYVVPDLWRLIKRFGAAGVIENIELREVVGAADKVVTGYIDDRNRAVIAAVCQATGAGRFFEIGTNRGRTAWTVARHNPKIEVFTLDLPPTGVSAADVELEITQADQIWFQQWKYPEALAGTPEASRVTLLHGDSATFEFHPYEGNIDVVYVDGSHSYSYVKNDTEAALRMLSPSGTVFWDDYPNIPGIYEYLTELAPSLDGPIYHLHETRLAMYTRADLVSRLSEAEVAAPIGA